jgi:cyclohexyl-isocyanide hydratase
MQMLNVGLLTIPGLTQLDLTGPAEVFARMPDTKVHLVWKNREPITSHSGVTLVPSTTFADCPQLDVLCVPGGFGIAALMSDTEVLDFLRHQADKARYVTSVCNGSLLLGAAGLLKGYRSACHWSMRDQLALFGAIPVNERVVRDRNRMSGGGVTAGIDFALTLVAEIAGADVAKAAQLTLEYAPAPPFDCGTPEAAGPELTKRITERMAQGVANHRSAAEAAARALV